MLTRPGPTILALSIATSGLTAPLAARGSQDLPPPPPPPPGVQPPSPPTTPTPPAPPPTTTAPAPPPSTSPATSPDSPLPPLPPPPPPPPGVEVSPELPTAPSDEPPPTPRRDRTAPTRQTNLVDFSSDAPEAPTEPKEHWYGWQILLGLAGSYTLLIGGLAAEEPAVAVVGGLGHFVAGPITHWGNGMVARGFASLGLNFGLPLGASFAGAALGALTDDDATIFISGSVGGTLGLIVAPIIDVAALAYKPISPENEKTTSAPRLHLTPILGQGRTGLSLSGQF